MLLIDNKKVWANLLPLTYTRSVAECRVGILTIAEKWANYFESIQIESSEDYLKSTISITDKLTVASHILPNKILVDAIKNLAPNTNLIYQNEIIASNDVSENPNLVEYENDISMIQFPWDLFLLNDQEIRADFELLTKGKTSQKLSDDNKLIGNQLFIEKGAKINCSILNTSTGPIYIGKNAEVMEGAMIRGPFALGENSQVKMGAKIYGATTFGPGCKVGGEITNSIFFANSNKAHDGYLGNSIIGEWCNLGADTNSSNLKNNYTKVDIYNYTEKKSIDTGQQFLGLIMGDHSKAGINTMFNTGTVVGVSANIVGAGFPNKHIPSFSWSISEKLRGYDIEKAIETIKIVYGRRNKILTEKEEAILRHLHTNTLNK